MIRNITVIGSGVMGSGIAQAFALAGYTVILNDISEDYLERAKTRIIADLSLQIEEGVLAEKDEKKALDAIAYVVDLGLAVKEADYIIEAIPEVIVLKWELYEKLAKLMKPTAIVASNTSSFPISLLSEHCDFADRMVITHFFNPAHLIPLVEIVQNKVTRPDVVTVTLELIRSIGKSPVLLNKEIPGFIANRLQIALAREVFHLLEEGVASAEDIDLAITAGPGFRWAFIGPIEIADFGGLDTWQRVFDNVAPVLNQSNQAPDSIRNLVSQGKLGTKSGEGIFKYDAMTVAHKIRERDRRFIRLGKIKGL